jgi:Ni/Co efflux regulator RcnB
MKRIIALILLGILLISFAYSQTQTQPQRRNFMSQEVQYLMRLVRDLRELDKDKKVSITKNQAQKLIPILQELLKTSMLPKKDADKFISRIEGVLTDEQLTYLDKLQIERQKRFEEMRQKMQQNPQGSQTGQRQINPQWRGPQNISEKERQEFQKFMEAWSKGQPLNPFYHVTMYKKQLNDLIDYLKKK